MKWSDLPSLNSLKAFSAAAETGSYSQAGNALNVTHAAISQQVKALEARLGVSLIVRQGRGIALTAEGTALARDLAAGFAAIHGAIERLRDGDRFFYARCNQATQTRFLGGLPCLESGKEGSARIAALMTRTGIRV